MSLQNFSDPSTAEKLLRQIHKRAAGLGPIKIMEVCGTHTMEIGRLGLRALLPSSIALVSGPGCPVCVTPGDYIDAAAALALDKGVRIVSYGDMIRVPGNKTSLEKAKTSGARVDVVTSPLEALAIAKQHPKEEIVFLAVGFETTAPATAVSILNGYNEGLDNCSFFMSHRVVPPALAALLADKDIGISAFMLPGHVSAIIGEAPYDIVAQHGIPGVITGFEPLDILLGILEICTLLSDHTPKIINAYKRIVKQDGNPRAVAAIEKMFEPCDALWRGIGIIPRSGLAIRESYARMDASRRWNGMTDSAQVSPQPAGCSCGAVLKGILKPDQCPLFSTVCTPRTPVGPCMVSSEGSCAAYYKYGV